MAWPKMISEPGQNYEIVNLPDGLNLTAYSNVN